ncbi:DUF3465 domain-containing protein [Bdellovibrio svalbardensis]|uniref:DUF3465 domain-containing protein n=1 Tax=Bdellovibrio svalbardensis TaxID=2972972 RepID=A0ABT6DI91_9BACT|nr:DUF3465 domain-containing protein [Bdellovibrio svalbardensis]MDG0816212.1 DUF3465 domain-containing protein [Bdellovibrio svalbardensis]
MRNSIFLLILLLSSQAVLASEHIPACKNKNTVISYNNEQVLGWKFSEKSKFLSRAFIKGSIVGIIENRQGHIHFEVDFDKDLTTNNDRVEVIYNVEFGELPDFRVGDELIACGDFIVDSWSPLGAVVHWLHSNPNANKNKHEDGFLVINGQVTGLKK